VVHPTSSGTPGWWPAVDPNPAGGPRFGLDVSAGLTVSTDGLSLSIPQAAEASTWRAGLMEPPVATAGRGFVEFLIEEAGESGCCVVLGVTARRGAPPHGQSLFRDSDSHVYYCRDSSAWPGNRALAPSRLPCRPGDKVGLLVHRGALWVFVNGRQVGQGPMAAPLPREVRFVVGLYQRGQRVRVVMTSPPQQLQMA
jgi:hypothetical protein